MPEQRQNNLLGNTLHAIADTHSHRALEARSSFALIPAPPTSYVRSSIILHAASNGACEDVGHLVVTTALLLALEYCLQVGRVG